MAIVLKPKVRSGVQLMSKTGFDALTTADTNLTYAVITSGIYKALTHILTILGISGNTLATFKIGNNSGIPNEVLNQIAALMPSDGSVGLYDGTTYLGFEGPSTNGTYSFAYGSQLANSLSSYNMTGNKTFQLKNNTRTLSFSTGVITQEVNPITVNRGFPLSRYTIPSLSNSIKPGSMFSGWSDDDEATTVLNLTNYYIEADTTLYAVWTADTVSVTFDQQGGSNGTTSLTCDKGSTPSSITVPTRTGYKFLGYYSQTNYKGTGYVSASGVFSRQVSSDITLYAAWAKSGSYSDGTVNGNLLYVGGYGYPGPDGWTIAAWGTYPAQGTWNPYPTSAADGWCCNANEWDDYSIYSAYNVVTRQYLYEVGS